MTKNVYQWAVESSSAVYIRKVNVLDQGKIIDHLREAVYTVRHSAPNR